MRQEKRRQERNAARPYKKYSATVRIHARKSFTHCSILNMHACGHGTHAHRVSSDTRHLPHAIPSRVLVYNFSWGLNFHGLPPHTKICPHENLTHKILCPRKFVHLRMHIMRGLAHSNFSDYANHR